MTPTANKLKFRRAVSAKRDYYEVLGVGREATAPEIKRAYRKKAVALHPDRNPGDPEAEEAFKQAAEAFEVLSDDEKRDLYNRFGHDGPKQAGFSGFQGTEDVFAHFGDMFGDMFGNLGFGGRRRGGPARGADVRMKLTIPFSDVLDGVEKEILVPKRQRCEDCGGSGAEEGSSPTDCHQCGGSGQVVHRQGFFSLQTTCPGCRGDGKIIEKPCGGCSGTGVQMNESKLSIKIPAGIDDGQTMRVAGGGEAGAQGGPAGSLFVQIEVEPDPRFVREDFDLHSKVEIDMLQACLGCTITMPTVDGEHELEIEPGTQPEEITTLKGKGIPVLGRRGRGDHHFHIRVQIPKKLKSDQAEALRKVAEDRGIEVSKKKGFLGSLLGGKD